MRKIININKNWTFTKEGKEEHISLPHTWNSQDGQDGGNDYYRGKCVYKYTFDNPQEKSNQLIFLEFTGVSMTCTVYLNNKRISEHKGGYSTFRVELTPELREENVLVVEVDNRERFDIYPQRADFTFYGGIYRDVNLIIVPENHFDLTYHGSPGIKVTPEINLEKKTANIKVESWVSGTAKLAQFSVDGQTKESEVINNYAAVSFLLESPHLWDGINDPYLYEVVANLDSGDQISTKFGCRHIEFHPQSGFKLNGNDYPLRGVSRHQDFEGIGNALHKEHHDLDMELIKEIGANTIRLAHYQHDQYFYDLCDKHGLIVWAEIPYITQHMNEGYENSISQMRELVLQNYNHPSIVTWGLSNEITAASALNEELYKNHHDLNDLCHELDSTRPTVLANVFMLDIEDEMLEITDINSYNLYFGWYLGELEENDEFFDEYHKKYPERVIGFSEYGADANPKYQSANPVCGDYTESYQALYHEHILQMINKRPWIWATHVWNMFDFGADGRIEGGKPGQNQKGLVTFDRTIKKDAFYLYKAAWNKTEPFVHIAGKRYIKREETVTEIVVYSNTPRVDLYVDGILHESKMESIVFKFNISINEKHKIKAVSDDLNDEFELEFVTEKEASYIYKEKTDVTNWFDQGDINDKYFSILDTLNEIRENEKTGSMINQMMKSGAESHGDVAEAVQDNPALQKMLGKMQLIKILGQSGASEEDIQQINRILQTIKKEK